MRIDKEYRFESGAGTQTLAELFEGRSQLMVYHFMFGPDWDEAVRAARCRPTASTARWSTSTSAT